MPEAFDATSTLLCLIQEVAYSDGSMSAREENLIADLIRLHQLKEERGCLVDRLIENYGDQAGYRSVARGASRRKMRAELLLRLECLESQSDRELAVSLSCLTASIDRNPCDESLLNADEQSLYGEIVRVSRLSDETVALLEAECEALLSDWSRPSVLSVVKYLFD